MMCLAVGLFVFLLIGTLCDSWICVTFSLIKLGKFSIITFSSRFSIVALLLLLVFLLYGYCYVSCCPAFPLIPLHSFWASFPFLALSWCFFLPCPPAHWSHPLLHSVYFWFLLLCSLIQKLYPCILHFLLAPVDSFYFLFHVDVVCSEFSVVSL